MRRREVPGGGDMVLWGEAGALAPDPNVVTFVVGQLGTVGALVWYLWHQTSKEVPRARHDYLVALAEQRAGYTASLDSCRSEMSGVRDDLRELVLACQDLSDAVREAMDIKRRPRVSPPGTSQP
jgi:hypothetical protein